VTQVHDLRLGPESHKLSEVHDLSERERWSGRLGLHNSVFLVNQCGTQNAVMAQWPEKTKGLKPTSQSAVVENLATIQKEVKGMTPHIIKASRPLLAVTIAHL
jgi:hypothetical protein